MYWNLYVISFNTVFVWYGSLCAGYLSWSCGWFPHSVWDVLEIFNWKAKPFWMEHKQSTNEHSNKAKKIFRHKSKKCIYIGNWHLTMATQPNSTQIIIGICTWTRFRIYFVSLFELRNTIPKCSMDRSNIYKRGPNSLLRLNWNRGANTNLNLNAKLDRYCVCGVNFGDNWCNAKMWHEVKCTRGVAWNVTHLFQ